MIVVPHLHAIARACECLIVVAQRRSDSLRRGGAAILAFLGIATAAQAHETWLLPASAPAEGGVALVLTSGMAFPTGDHAIEPGRVTAAICRRGEASAPLEAGARGKHELALQARLPGQGTTTCGLVLPARPITLEAGHVEEYLAELDAAPATRARWQKLGVWRERYRKSVKAILDGGEGADVTAPIGLPLEIVPLQAPHTLRPGDTLRLRVLADGRPLPDFRLGLNAAGARPRHARSDAAGEVGFRLDRAGPLLLHGIVLRAVDAADRDWDSDFTTLTLSVPVPVQD